MIKIEQIAETKIIAITGPEKLYSVLNLELNFLMHAFA